jgi:hypothetical protein
MVSRPASSQAIKIQFFQKKRQKFTEGTGMGKITLLRPLN